MYNNDSEIYESAMRSHNEVAINESTDMITATGYGWDHQLWKHQKLTA